MTRKKFIVLIRPEFKTVCDEDACRAGMFNHILYNIARAKQQGSDYWHSTGDDIWEETQRSWGKSKTLKEIKDLVTSGLIAQTSNPKNSWDRTKYYTFGEPEAKKLHDLCVKFKVCLASIKFPSPVSHLLKITNAFCKSNKCICCNQQIDLLDLPDRFVKSEIETGLEEALEAVSEDPKDSTQDSTQDSFLGERESSPDPVEQSALPEKKEASSIAYSQDIPTSTTDSSRLQENKAHQSIDILTSQETVPAQKSAAPKLPNMTRDVLQRENRPPTVAEQKRIDEREQREKAQQVTRRKAELWTLFDGLFGSRVDRAGYNKSHVEGLALNPLATDPIIKQAFESVAKSAADKKDPTKLTITNVANVVPAYIRTEQIKVVQSKQPKQETELERMKREQREAMAKRALQEVAQ